MGDGRAWGLVCAAAPHAASLPAEQGCRLDQAKQREWQPRTGLVGTAPRPVTGNKQFPVPAGTFPYTFP